MEIEALSSSTPAAMALFLQEPPNIFRNSIWDAAYAASVLSSVNDGSDERSQATALLHAITRTLEAPAPSPIDDAWSARWSLLQRRALLARALGQSIM